jgi:hypothetical protein
LAKAAIVAAASLFPNGRRQLPIIKSVGWKFRTKLIRTHFAMDSTPPPDRKLPSLHIIGQWKQIIVASETTGKKWLKKFLKITRPEAKFKCCFFDPSRQPNVNQKNIKQTHQTYI